MQFKVGDIVSWKSENRIGKVITTYGVYNIGVDFGGAFQGHNLDDRIKTNTGWYLDSSELELAKKNNIINY